MIKTYQGRVSRVAVNGRWLITSLTATGGGTSNIADNQDGTASRASIGREVSG
jgi:hypothetical protein